MTCSGWNTVRTECGSPRPIEYPLSKEFIVRKCFNQLHYITMSFFQFSLCFCQRCALVFFPELNIHCRVCSPIIWFGKKWFMLTVAIGLYPIQQQMMHSYRCTSTSRRFLSLPQWVSLPAVAISSANVAFCCSSLIVSMSFHILSNCSFADVIKSAFVVARAIFFKLKQYSKYNCGATLYDERRSTIENNFTDVHFLRRSSSSSSQALSSARNSHRSA